MPVILEHRVGVKMNENLDIKMKIEQISYLCIFYFVILVIIIIIIF